MASKTLGLTEAWGTMVAVANRRGSPDPEAIAAAAFERLLRRGHTLDNTKSYWATLAQSEATNDWRARTSRGKNPQTDSLDADIHIGRGAAPVSPADILPDYAENTERIAIARQEIHWLRRHFPVEFDWLYQYINLPRKATNLERVTAFNYRKRLAAAMAKWNG